MPSLSLSTPTTRPPCQRRSHALLRSKQPAVPAHRAAVSVVARAQGGKHDGDGMPWGSQAVALGAAALLLLTPGAALAGKREKVAEFGASGLVFKDTVEVTAMEDPEVEGVTIYLSDFKKSFADKLGSKDFFDEPSQASVTCAATGPIVIKDLKKISADGGVEVFSERKGLSLLKNKETRVRRVFDEDRSTLLYISYSTRLTSARDEGGASQGRYKTSLCALPVPASALAPPEAP